MCVFILINTFCWPSIRLNDFIVFPSAFILLPAFSLSLIRLYFASFFHSFNICVDFNGHSFPQPILMIKCSWDKNNNEIAIELNSNMKIKDNLNKRDGWWNRKSQANTVPHRTEHIIRKFEKNKDWIIEMRTNRRWKKTHIVNDEDNDHVQVESGWFTFIDFDFDCPSVSISRLFPPRFSRATYFRCNHRSMMFLWHSIRLMKIWRRKWNNNKIQPNAIPNPLIYHFQEVLKTKLILKRRRLKTKKKRNFLMKIWLVQIMAFRKEFSLNWY